MKNATKVLMFLLCAVCVLPVFGQVTNFQQRGKATQELKVDGLAAAHPTLPISSKVKIVNIKTGKEIEVTITGRISLSQNRIVDLSPGAWMELGLSPDNDVRLYTGDLSRLSPVESENAVASGRQTYRIGDTGPGGGTIFYVNDGRYMEISEKLGEYNWDRSVDVANDYRGGNFTDWRLPRENEFKLLQQYYRRVEKDVDSSVWWWTLESRGSDYAYTYAFTGLGSTSFSSKTTVLSICAIRVFEITQ